MNLAKLAKATKQHAEQVYAITLERLNQDKKKATKRKGASKMKRITAIKGVLSTLKIAKNVALGETVPGREDAFNSTVGDITVDTCLAFDTHMWETGIKRDDKWIIVEQYKSRELAKKGHEKWRDKIQKNPVLGLKDINVWGL